MQKFYSIINQKGGVGKTTTTINLGTAMAACGARVLLVDMDPQGNLSTGMGVERRARRRGIYDVLVNEHSINDTKQPSSYEKNKILFWCFATVCVIITIITIINDKMTHL